MYKKSIIILLINLKNKPKELLKFFTMTNLIRGKKYVNPKCSDKSRECRDPLNSNYFDIHEEDIIMQEMIFFNLNTRLSISMDRVSEILWCLSNNHPVKFKHEQTGISKRTLI